MSNLLGTMTALRNATDAVVGGMVDVGAASAARPAPGCLDVLNCGAGHLTFRFDREKTDEAEKAKKVIRDMLGRGYMIFVKVDGEQRRVRQFDPAHEEYILEEPDDLPEPPDPVDEPKPTKKRRGRPPGKRVAMREVTATAIGPTAGG